MKKLPFTILALSCFGQVPETVGSAKPVDVHLGNMDEAVSSLAGTLSIPVLRDLCPAGSLTFSPRALKDFRPQEIIRRIPYLQNLADAGKYVETAAAAGNTDVRIAQGVKTQWPEFPIDLRIPSAPAHAHKTSHGAVDDILSMVAMPAGTGTGARVGEGGAKTWKEQIDTMTALILEAVFKDEVFRGMEASWRGLEILVKQVPVKEAEEIALKCMPIGGDVLADVLYRLSAELAETPPSLILLDHSFDNTPAAIDLLEKVAEFASTLLVPVVVWLGPSFFHVETWNGLKKLPYLNHYLEDAAYAKWRKLRVNPTSQWLVMTANRFLARTPYGKDNPPGTVPFTEQCPLWVSPLWALGALVAKSVTKYGWPTRFTDYRQICLENLSVWASGGENPVSTESVFSEDRISQFIEAGITPITGILLKDSVLMPKESILSGGSLQLQLFLNRLLAYLFEIREESGDEPDPETLAEKIESGLAEIFRRTGHHGPGDLSVRPSVSDTGEGLQFRIALTPPGTVLHNASKLELDFRW